jgi:hypothetical protein
VAEMSRMLFVILTLICLPAKAEVLSLPCDGTMKAEEEQAKPHAITKLGLMIRARRGLGAGPEGSSP